MNYVELTTLTELRTDYLATTGTSDDTLLLATIREQSRNAEGIANRYFVPRVETRAYGVPRERSLMLDGDLLALTTLANGDGAIISANDYLLYPLNESVKAWITLKLSSSTIWHTDTSGNAEGVVSVAGVWGYHSDYGSAFETAGTLSGNVTSSATTGFGTLVAGGLYRVESEYVYADTTTSVVRGVNGSTAVAHSTGATVARWRSREIENVVKVASAAAFRLRVNPVGDTVRVGEYVFSTPRDVSQWMSRQIDALGLERTAFA